jgi:hypothetical protein
MKTLKIPFCHPVEGKISLSRNGHTLKSGNIKSNECYEIELSLEGIGPGAYDINFEWEQDEDQYSINKTIVISA